MLDWNTLSRDELEAMVEAGHQVLECYRVLAKSSDNIIGEILKSSDTFYEMDHYPPGDIYDAATHSQYYYHAHREGEHGHFHTFLRSEGMDSSSKPIRQQSDQDYMSEREDQICHLIAISMDNKGFPTSLFTTNRWVTAENWYKAEDVFRFLDNFEIDLVPPSWPVNIWLTGIIRLYKPIIKKLIIERDAKIADWQKTHPDSDVFEDRDLEVTSELAISVEDYLNEIQHHLRQKSA